MIAALITAAMLAMGAGGTAQAAKRPCVEDMPCWNCHTMGNRVCGSTRVVTTVRGIRLLLRRVGVDCAVVVRHGDVFLVDCYQID